MIELGIMAQFLYGMGNHHTGRYDKKLGQSNDLLQREFDSIESHPPAYQCFILRKIYEQGEKSREDISIAYQSKITKWHWINGLVLSQFLNETAETKDV